jgi:hypothetical protein
MILLTSTVQKYQDLHLNPFKYVITLYVSAHSVIMCVVIREDLLCLSLYCERVLHICNVPK